MKEQNSKLSNYQITTLITCFAIGSTLNVSAASAAKQDAWLAFLLGMLGGSVLIGMYVLIALKNPSLTLVLILEKCFGKVMGKIFSVFYIWYFVHLAALVLRNLGEYAQLVNYPETPLLFIIACLAAVVVTAVKAGISVIGRISELFFVILVLFVTFVFFALIPIYQFDNLKPVLAQGIKPVLSAAFGTVAFPFGETVAFLMVYPKFHKQKGLAGSVFTGVLICGAIILSMTVRNIMVLGADMMSRDVFPSQVVFRLLPKLDVDPLLDIIFVCTTVIKAGICIYAAAAGIRDLLRLDDYIPFVLPLSAFTVSLSLWVYRNLMEMIDWAGNIWPYYSIPFQILIPFFLLLVSLVKFKKGNASKKKKEAAAD